jgi:hypothetical protein
MTAGRIAVLGSVFILVLSWGRATGEAAVVRTGTGITMAGKGAEVRVLSVNDGPGDVYDLTVVMETPWKTSESLVRPLWPAKGENRVLFTVTPGPGAGGRYPVIVLLTFRDAKGVPSTVIDTSIIDTGKGHPPAVRLTSPGAVLYVRGELDFTLENPEPSGRTVHCRLVYPPSLAVDKDRMDLRLAGSSQKKGTFKIMNRYAGTGSDVPVFVLAEYDDGSVHETVTARTDIVVANLRESPSWVRPLLWGLLGVSGAAALYSWRSESRRG